MTVIYIDGPEKAGKTTLANHLAEEYGARIRHWGPVEGDWEYAVPLRMDINSDQLVVWDRGWVAEYVYAKMLKRDRRLREDPWLGEWLHGRALDAIGVRIILLGPNAKRLYRLRNESDLEVDAARERAEYREYAERFGLRYEANLHTSEYVHWLADDLVRRAEFVGTTQLRPPMYCGLPPGQARLVFVGERRNSNPAKMTSGAWLPFTSPHTERYGRVLGDDALKCGWTNAAECDPAVLRGAKVIIACGQKARDWVKHYVNHGVQVHHVYHPSWLYRWGKAKNKVEATESKILKIWRNVQ